MRNPNRNIRRSAPIVIRRNGDTMHVLPVQGIGGTGFSSAHASDAAIDNHTSVIATLPRAYHRSVGSPNAVHP